MKNKFLILCSIIMFLPAVLRGGSGTTSANFLKLPQGNRATAMGSSFAAIAEGPTAVYWNPAGLAVGFLNEGRMVYNRWVSGIHYGFAAYRHDQAIGGFGLGITYLNSGAITQRPSGRAEEGTYKFENIAVTAGQGVRINENFNVGVNLKFIGENTAGKTANALAVGLGGQYSDNIDENHLLMVGISLDNLGTKMGYDSKYHLPAVIRVSVADETLGGKLTGGAEVDYYITDDSVVGGVGMEFSPVHFLHLRGGYRFGKEINRLPYGITLGFGIEYVEDLEYLIDYSFAPMGDLGFVNRVGLGIRF